MIRESLEYCVNGSTSGAFAFEGKIKVAYKLEKCYT